MKIDQSLEN